jgi:hypothetical protein
VARRKRREWVRALGEPANLDRSCDETPRFICIGEALIELTRGPDGSFAATCSGDSFNTAAGSVSSGMV